MTLDGSDPQRVIRLVTRRCSLNLIEVLPGRAIAHFWGQQGQGDLRPYLKQQGLARRDTEVILVDRKREVSTVKSGDDFLYGDPVNGSFPLSLYWKKWQRRYLTEPDDWIAAPLAQPNRLRWTALKSAWRLTTPLQCPNCDQPTIVTNFGLVMGGMVRREPRYDHVCPRCRRVFEDRSIDRYRVMQRVVDDLYPVLPAWCGRREFMNLWCVKCNWEMEVTAPEHVRVCPNCKSADPLYLRHGFPICRLCGETTVPTSASNVGSTCDCPRGHYRECHSKYSGHYAIVDGRRFEIDDHEGDAVATALIALKTRPDSQTNGAQP